MALQDSILRFREQFAWQPEVVHNEALKPHKHYIVVGMGGSHLGPWYLKRYGGASNLTIHRDYGIPEVPEEQLAESLVILSSYSGGTEEVLDAGRVALERGLSIAAISTGGKLIEFAREHALPHVVMPDLGLQPRIATGLSMLGIARLMQNAVLEDFVRSAGSAIDPSAGHAEGERIAEALRGRVPLIYASHAHMPLAYTWKIKLNESAKIPAFCNAFPEMCHNELCGFDVVDSTRPLSAQMHAILLDDPSDHPRNIVRMRTVAELLGEKGIPTTVVQFAGEGFTKAFTASLLADWVSLNLASHYGVPDEEVPLVEDFKKRIG